MRRVLLLAAALTALPLRAQFYSAPKGTVLGQSRVAVQAAGKDIRIDQRLKEFVPLDAKLKDEEGEQVTLGKYFVDKPVVIVPVFYKCGGICTNEFNGLAEALRGFRRHFVGKDFVVVAISIDPTETPTIAAAKKDMVVSAYLGSVTDRSRRVMTENGWHFLTGSETEVRKVTDALGFKYTYEKASGNIVHPAGIMVLTPAGQISRYFLSTDFPQQILLDSIQDAQQRKIGVRDDRPFFLQCVQIDPMTGQRTLNILNTVKTFALVTVIALVVSIGWMSRRQRSKNPKP